MKPSVEARGVAKRYGSLVALEDLTFAAQPVRLLGIDRWVGGTHLTPTRVWRWDGAAQRLIEPP